MATELTCPHCNNNDEGVFTLRQEITISPTYDKKYITWRVYCKRCGEFVWVQNSTEDV